MDDTPMVRRSAATHLAVSQNQVLIFQKFTKQIPNNFIISEIIPLFNALAQDEQVSLDLNISHKQDSVRLLSVEDLIVISQAIKVDGVKAHVLPTLRTLCSDSSWRVRYMVADKLIQVSF